MGVVVDDEKVVDPAEDVIQPELQRRQFPELLYWTYAEVSSRVLNETFERRPNRWVWKSPPGSEMSLSEYVGLNDMFLLGRTSRLPP